MHPYCDQKAPKFSVPSQSVVLKPDTAYYHPHPQNKNVTIGYLRISDYLIASHELKSTLKEYAELLDALEQKTDVLILDQTNNCGGNVEFAEILLSFFYDKPYTPVQYKFLATEKEFKHWSTIHDKMAKKNPQQATKLDALIERIKSPYLHAKLTTMGSLFGQTSMPARQIYSHPILLLVNEFSGSAGDVFPAYMQFSSRATLMGHRTMGAGGHARPGFTLSSSKIQVKIPKMLFYLPNGTALENRGANPEFFYKETLEDILYNYRSYYSHALNKALKVTSDKH